METNIDNLRRLLDQLKSLGFLQRLFKWKSIKNLVIDASVDLQKVLGDLTHSQEEMRKGTCTISELEKDIAIADRRVQEIQLANQELKLSIDEFDRNNKQLLIKVASSEQTIGNLTERKEQINLELIDVKKDLEHLEYELQKSLREITKFQAEEGNRKLEYSKAVATLSKIQEEIQSARQSELDQRHQEQLQKLQRQMENWSNHQQNVKLHLKAVCNRQIIRYEDKVPFKGEPDNTLTICNEYIVFDAKSPRGEDLTNFPKYLREQAEAAKKYANIDNVKKSIFFVVPSNTLEVLETYVYDLADYTVYVLPPQALEPILLNLKKIEDYDFAEQLAPEDRENICRVLGKFGHLTKRRAQIDIFFIKQFLELSYKAEGNLPPDFYQRAADYEKAEKINPPTERRTKRIDLRELEIDFNKIANETVTKGLPLGGEAISIALNDLPLYSLDGDDQ
jgi:hypothetical protein